MLCWEQENPGICLFQAEPPVAQTRIPVLWLHKQAPKFCLSFIMWYNLPEANDGVRFSGSHDKAGRLQAQWVHPAQLLTCTNEILAPASALQQVHSTPACTQRIMLQELRLHSLRNSSCDIAYRVTSNWLNGVRITHHLDHS